MSKEISFEDASLVVAEYKQRALKAEEAIENVYDYIVLIQESMDVEGESEEQIILAMFEHSKAAIRRIIEYRQIIQIDAQQREKDPG